MGNEKVALTIFDPEKVRYENALVVAGKYAEIKTVGDAERARTLSISINQFITLVNNKRKESTRPERDEIDRVNNYVKSVIDLENLDKISKKLIKDVFLFDKEQKRMENSKQIDDVTARLDALKSGVAIHTNIPVVAPIAKTRDNWVYEVVDFAKLDSEYKIDNKDMINSKIKAGVREIDGLIIKNEPIAVRR